VAQKYFLLKKYLHSIYVEMAAERYSSDVLQMFYGPIPVSEKRNQRESLEPEKKPIIQRVPNIPI